MKITIDGDCEWNTNSLTIAEHDDGNILVSVHDYEDANPELGRTVIIERADLVRLLRAAEAMTRQLGDHP